jgi:uncharacterized protein YgiM (DUF1202 family)
LAAVSCPLDAGRLVGNGTGSSAVAAPGAAAAASLSSGDVSEESVSSAGSAIAAVSPAETVPLPTRRPSPDDDGTANWVRPSAYVNLREGPSSTARVVSVVAKGAKLRIVARKRGWVQVADPATSQTGWIYSGHTEIVP